MAPIIPIIAMLAAQVGGAIAQSRENKRTAKRAHSQNLELMKYQQDYNLPANQMRRFAEAGLNPNLMYGQGDAGNLSSVPSYPKIENVDYMSGIQNLGQLPMQIQQMKLLESQSELTRNKAKESGVKQELMKAQQALVKANPYLNPEYMDSLVRNMLSVANIKEQESTWKLDFLRDYTKVLPSGEKVHFDQYQRGMEVMDKQLELLQQKYRLGEMDAKIKAEIIQSKEFANDLSEIQRDWMRSGDITPQHIYTFMMLLMSKLLTSGVTGP